MAETNHDISGNRSAEKPIWDVAPEEIDAMDESQLRELIKSLTEKDARLYKALQLVLDRSTDPWTKQEAQDILNPPTPEQLEGRSIVDSYEAGE